MFDPKPSSIPFYESVLTVICQLIVQPNQGVRGVKASIVAFQAVDPGSIPGERNIFFGFVSRHRHIILS
jgi:hypothetical protein